MDTLITSLVAAGGGAVFTQVLNYLFVGRSSQRMDLLKILQTEVESLHKRLDQCDEERETLHGEVLRLRQEVFELRGWIGR